MTYSGSISNEAARKAAETDKAGRTTRFGYDKFGRLEKVIDALDGETIYGYDAAGNRTRQTDAEGRTTRMEYDDHGRLVKRILPLLQEETFEYDPVTGQLLEHTDFNGQVTRYDEYDADGRLLRKILGHGSGNEQTVEYAYTPGGLREQAGGETFEYDERGRLWKEIKENGFTLEYGYDEAGNRTSVKTSPPAGQGDPVTTTYDYDELNRLKKTIDDTGETVYTYLDSPHPASQARRENREEDGLTPNIWDNYAY